MGRLIRCMGGAVQELALPLLAEGHLRGDTPARLVESLAVPLRATLPSQHRHH